MWKFQYNIRRTPLFLAVNVDTTIQILGSAMALVHHNTEERFLFQTIFQEVESVLSVFHRNFSLLYSCGLHFIAIRIQPDQSGFNDSD